MPLFEFVKEQRELYQPPTEPVIVEVPEMLYLMLDGKGPPDMEKDPDEDNEFNRAIGALYGTAYSMKFSSTSGHGIKIRGWQSFKVPPAECLWWMEDGSDFDPTKPDEWRWTQIMRVPDYVEIDTFGKVTDELVEKEKDDIYKQIRMEKFREGPSVQMMHIGSFGEEMSSMQKMLNFAKEKGYVLHGKHHELYFGPPHRTLLGKQKTVLRHPVKKVVL